MANQKVKDLKNDTTGDNKTSRTGNVSGKVVDEHATAVPKFSGWGSLNAITDNEDDYYSHIFNKVRQERYNGGYEENLEFGRDTNRLDYFCVTPFDVNGNDQLPLHHGGGGYTTRQMPTVVGKATVAELAISSTAPARPKVIPPLAAANNNGIALRQIIGETDGRRKGGGGSKRSTGGEQRGSKVPLQWWKKCLMRLICRG